jgi:Mor family transcriptional regulator
MKKPKSERTKERNEFILRTMEGVTTDRDRAIGILAIRYDITRQQVYRIIKKLSDHQKTNGK